MLGYFVRMALRSLARTPALTSLMVLAIALGIGVCIITLTVYDAMAGNPIPWKSDLLYRVTMDSWSRHQPFDERRPHLPPSQLTWRDAHSLAGSTVPTRKAIMYRADGVVAGGRNENRPMRVSTRITTADFFAMFDVPFAYGGGWDAAADTSARPVIVLSRDLNDELFGGANSVGRTLRWNDREFRVVGVLGEWLPMPRYYDLGSNSFDEPEAAYVPFGWGRSLELFSSGSIQCWKSEKVVSFRDLMGSECVWLQMWVELPDARSRERMQSFVDAYWSSERRIGRFERPRNNRLTPVGQWLVDNKAVPDDNRILVALSFAFLAVCLLNTVGLLLAKFHGAAGTSGIRRALGATRGQVVGQHLIETGVLAVAGSFLGLIIAALGLWGVRAAYSNRMLGGRGGYEELAQLDTMSLTWALMLAIVAALIAGLYPAWRIGRLQPGIQLKSQ
jgi:putative ABC transport system permease protein